MPYAKKPVSDPLRILFKKSHWCKARLKASASASTRSRTQLHGCDGDADMLFWFTLWKLNLTISDGSFSSHRQHDMSTYMTTLRSSVIVMSTSLCSFFTSFSTSFSRVLSCSVDRTQASDGFLRKCPGMSLEWCLSDQSRSSLCRACGISHYDVCQYHWFLSIVPDCPMTRQRMKMKMSIWRWKLMLHFLDVH